MNLKIKIKNPLYFKHRYRVYLVIKLITITYMRNFSLINEYTKNVLGKDFICYTIKGYTKTTN